VIILVVVLALLSTTLVGGVLGAWLALRFVQAIRPGREGDLLAELAALRASEGAASGGRGGRERDAQGPYPTGRRSMRGGVRRLVLPATRVGAINPEDTRDACARINAESREQQRQVNDLLDAEVLAARRRGYLE
jgi:hypothetical protein